MIVAHSAPGWGWKSCARDGTPQVVIGIPVAAGKLRTAEPEDGLDVRSGFALRQQIPGDPQIHDAPVRLRKGFHCEVLGGSTEACTSQLSVNLVRQRVRTARR
jgi:hypothetical protein